jgi:hypothetical protein
MIKITQLAGKVEEVEDSRSDKMSCIVVETVELEKDNPAAIWKRIWRMTDDGLICESTGGGYLIIPLNVLQNFVSKADPKLSPPPLKP